MTFNGPSWVEIQCCESGCLRRFSRSGEDFLPSSVEREGFVLSGPSALPGLYEVLEEDRAMGAGDGTRKLGQN